MADAYIESRLSGPAYGLIGVGAIGIAAQFINLSLQLLNVGMGAAAAVNNGGGEEAIVTLLSGTFGMAMSALAIVFGGLIIFAGFRMKDARSWNLAAGASVLAMLPCLSPCCILGLPAGIWSLMVLMDDEVKEEFAKGGLE
jgi:hypothetical protein